MKEKGLEEASPQGLESPSSSRTRITPLPPINLDDDGDEGENMVPSATPSRIRNDEGTKPIFVVDDDDDDDPFSNPPLERKGSFGEDSDVIVEEPPDEFSEYVIKARERAALAAALAKAASEPANGAGTSQKDAPSAKPTDRRAQITIRAMVSSELPGSATMVAKLKLTQGLRIVRDAWIKYQIDKGVPLPDESQGQIFLTWKGNRVYNAVSCADLGIQADSQGRLLSGPFGLGENGYRNGGVHFEAWTEEMYTQHLRDKERERLRTLGEFDEDDWPGQASQADVDQQEEAAQSSIRVILKAKDLDAFSTKVYMDTTVESMLMVFREQRKVPDEKEAALFFDGEKLDEATTIQDAGIEDMDSLEVHIK